ncbi:hypothetical protein FQZ97_1005130 [compost metagenome]
MSTPSFVRREAVKLALRKVVCSHFRNQLLPLIQMSARGQKELHLSVCVMSSLVGDSLPGNTSLVGDVLAKFLNLRVLRLSRCRCQLGRPARLGSQGYVTSRRH